MTRHLKRVLRKSIDSSKKFYLSFGSAVECPICQWTGRSFFRVFHPHKPAASFICPSCRSSERHRFAYFYLKNMLTSHADNVLHFAPEKCVEPWLRSISKQYLSVDLMSSSAMEHMDITDLRLDDNSFSLLWCSHVLEHIEDDRKAISELFRVLRPSGIAVILVPVYGESSYENPDIKSPADRLKHFKQEDHVRLYGLDIESRLKEAGFEVDIIKTHNIPREKLQLHVLDYPSTREIFICTKPRELSD